MHPDSEQKYYYGFRKSLNHPLDDNYWGSSKYLKESIKLYGINYFRKKIIRIFDNPETAMAHESLLHEKFKVDKHPLFFNRSRSTIWGYKSTGLILSGKSYEEIHGEEKAKILRENRSKAMKKYRKENPELIIGENNPNYGKKWSEEKKKKFALSRQKENHPCYGLQWINNGIKCKKIPLDDEIPEGWKKGRLTKDNGKKNYYIKLFKDENLSRKQFAEKYSINYSTLKNWVRNV